MPSGKLLTSSSSSHKIMFLSFSSSRTVFYELLTRRYPCPSHDSTGFPVDVTMVIYKIGRGHRQDISSRDAPKRIKVQSLSLPTPNTIHCTTLSYGRTWCGIAGSQTPERDRHFQQSGIFCLKSNVRRHRSAALLQFLLHYLAPVKIFSNSLLIIYSSTSLYHYLPLTIIITTTTYTTLSYTSFVFHSIPCVFHSIPCVSCVSVNQFQLLCCVSCVGPEFSKSFFVSLCSVWSYIIKTLGVPVRVGNVFENKRK